MLAILVGGIALVATTVRFVACPGCARITVSYDGGKTFVPHRFRNGRWDPADYPCACCPGDGRVTLLQRWLRRHGN